MPILIRDAATEYHAVIGLAAISSPVVQIAERDNWMGWDTKQFVAHIEAEPTAKVARWLARRIKAQLSEIYVDDLLRDGVLQPDDLKSPTHDVVARLRADAERHRAKHHRGGTDPRRPRHRTRRLGGARRNAPVPVQAICLARGDAGDSRTARGLPRTRRPQQLACARR